MKSSPLQILFFLTLMTATNISAASVSSITSRPFGTVDGRKALLYTLTNSKGATATISNYGGTVTSLTMPDRNGNFDDVVLGFGSLGKYVRESPYFGCLIGRFGNRIAKGIFTLNGKEYHLATNNFGNALHGGIKGFDKVVWQATPKLTARGPSLKLTYTSPDGEEGYPGNLKVTATYTLTERNELRLDCRAVTDRETVVNLTHHSYFNLAGQGNGTILNHVVTLDSSRYTPVGKTLIPTGQVTPVKGTPFDFRKPTSIGSRIDAKDQQLRFGGGYDHNWIADKLVPGSLTRIAKVEEPTSGRVMEVLSTEPAVQFYSGNFLDGTLRGKGGKLYARRGGFCLEPQHYPDSPNHPSFPSTVLKPGQIFRNTIIYRFSTDK